MKSSRLLLFVFLLLFYGSAAIDLFVPELSRSVNILLTLGFALLVYAWVGLHSKENDIPPPTGARMFSAIFPPFGIPYYLLRGFGLKKGSIGIVAALSYVFIMIAGYEALYRLPSAFQPGNFDQSLQRCAEIENNLIRTACYDDTVELLNLDSPNLPSYYSEVYLSQAPKEERPDCSQLSELLFDIAMGGSRTYLQERPIGFELRAQRDGGFFGTDTISGTTHGMKLRNLAVLWYEERVARLIASIPAEFEYELDVHLNRIEELSNAQFDYNTSLESYELFCNDGIRVTAKKDITAGFGTRSPTYVLLVNFIHPMNFQMEDDVASRRRI